MKTSLIGLFTGEAATAPLSAGIKTGVNQQSVYPHYNKLVSLNGGLIELANTLPVVGVLTDCSPKGDSATFETEGYEWVRIKVASSIVIDDLVVVVAGDGGTLTKLPSALVTTADLIAREGFHMSGIWKVEQVKTETTSAVSVIGASAAAFTADYALIRLDSRL